MHASKWFAQTCTLQFGKHTQSLKALGDVLDFSKITLGLAGLGFLWGKVTSCTDITMFALHYTLMNNDEHVYILIMLYHRPIANIRTNLRRSVNVSQLYFAICAINWNCLEQCSLS